MAKSLMALLDENADQIISNWTRSLKQMQGTGYENLPLEGLQRDCTDLFRDLLEGLEVNSITPLIDYMENTARMKIPMGFGLASILRAFYTFKPTAWPLIKEEYGKDPKLLAEASEQIDSLLISAICEFSELYLRETDRRIRDYIRQNEEINRRFLRLSIVDGLTGLYNHKYFHSVLDKEVRRAKRYGGSIAVIMIDIDNFKKINETYSHERGDELLQALGTLLVRTFREVDTVARYGGEEFGVIMPQTKKESATIKAEMMRRSIEEEPLLVVGAERVKVTISAGVSGAEGPPYDKLKLIAEAEKALLMSKEAGRNRVTVA